jgi:hypothetical protein
VARAGWLAWAGAAALAWLVGAGDGDPATGREERGDATDGDDAAGGAR